MLAPSIKSRPVYSKLVPRPGTLHLMVVDAAGAQAILDLAARTPAGFFDRASILHVSAASAGTGLGQRLQALQPYAMYDGPSIAAAMPRLAQILGTADMGTQLYLAGTEGLIGQATKVALETGMELASIQAEHRGSEARRVQCAHCKGITENVQTQPVVCTHCELVLSVRDHYSRRIAAFQGVCVDAEEPGLVPTAEELFR